jgi:hypothetical protein
MYRKEAKRERLSHPEDGGNTVLRTVGKLLLDYTASHPE